MEQADLWTDNKTKYVIREAELIQIWGIMPSRLKLPFLDNGKKVNTLDIVSFSYVMGHFCMMGNG